MQYNNNNNKLDGQMDMDKYNLCFIKGCLVVSRDKISRFFSFLEMFNQGYAVPQFLC
jgi:hypothetical protein